MTAILIISLVVAATVWGYMAPKLVVKCVDAFLAGYDRSVAQRKAR